MVRGSDHSPRVDEKELAATVVCRANSSGVVHSLSRCHSYGILPCAPWGTRSKNVLDRDNIDDRLWLGLTQELGLEVGGATNLDAAYWLV